LLSAAVEQYVNGEMGNRLPDNAAQKLLLD
jgi:hypothetical protein